ncbi:MAG: DMT family transporter [Pseudomonadota bacterium]
MASSHHSPTGAAHPSASAANAERAQHLRGLLLCAFAAVIWSTGGVVARTLESTGWTVIFWRSLFAVLFLVGLLLVRERGRFFAVFREAGLAGVGIGLCFATASTCYVIGLQYTTVAKLLFLQGIAPFLAAVLGWLFMRERVGLRTWVAMAAALVGVGIMEIEAFSGAVNPIGDILGLVIAAAFAGATVIMRSNRKVRMTPAACLAALFAGLVAATQAPSLVVSAQDFPYLLFFGAGQLGLGMALFTSGGRHIPAATSALISLLEPALGPTWVWLVYDENPGGYAIAGGAILLGSLTLYSLYDLQAGRRIAPPAV